MENKITSERVERKKDLEYILSKAKRIPDSGRQNSSVYRHQRFWVIIFIKINF